MNKIQKEAAMAGILKGIRDYKKQLSKATTQNDKSYCIYRIDQLELRYFNLCFDKGI